MDETLTMVLHPGRTHGYFVTCLCEQNLKTWTFWQILEEHVVTSFGTSRVNVNETLSMFTNLGRTHNNNFISYITCQRE
jgi:hypothetical protein